MFEIEKRKKFDRIFPKVWVLSICLVVLVIASFYFLPKYRPNLSKTAPQIASEETTSQVAPEEKPAEQPASESAGESKKAVVSSPPKHSSGGKIKGSKIQTSAGTATAVSTGELSSDDISRLSSYATAGATSSITYTDTTGRYPSLGDTLKTYLNNTLLWRQSDLSYMHEIRVVDCADCGYSGLYTGSYIQSGPDITKAFGYITLNALPYKDSPYFTDYMKLILSHEYGHHYTLYHRWVDLDIPSGERFPDAYYSVRPLSKSTTASDYSLGWGNCDVEIVAEDYSYLYSGYGYHGMQGAYGYPSSGTRSWLVSLSEGAGGDTPPATPPDTPPVVPPETPPEIPSAADAVPPQVSFVKPENGATISGDFEIQVSASDNVQLSRIELYFDGVLILNIAQSFIGVMDSTQASNGQHTLLAKAFDATGNMTETSIVITIENLPESPPG